MNHEPRSVAYEATESYCAAIRDVHASPLLGQPCPCCASGWIGQDGTALRCANCGWLRYPRANDADLIPTRRPVMNSPADEAEARDRANTAPPQADPDARCRGETGTSSGSEARPVTATAHPSNAGKYEMNLQPIPVTEIVAALEREARNTDTDPRWLAAAELRRIEGWEARTLMCAVDQRPSTTDGPEAS